MSEERSTAWHLFEPRYLCMTVQDAMVSDEEITLFGTRTALDKRIDAELRGKMQRYFLTIAQMADIMEKGYPISVVRTGDTVKIYNAVQNHLSAWLIACENHINLRTVPRDDLLKLERLADRVYAPASVHQDAMTAPTHQGGMFNTKVTELLRRLSNSGIAAPTPEPESEVPLEDTRQRRSLVQEIIDLKGR